MATIIMKLYAFKPRVAPLQSARTLKTLRAFKQSTGDARLRGGALQARNRRLLQNNPLCVECARVGVARMVDEWDHIVPLSEGGADHEGNLQGLCTEHHRAKSAREDAQRQARQHR